jgi:hypothetical protein
MSKTTILVEKSTRDNLKALGKKGDSYDRLINELLALKEEGINQR